MYPKLLENKDNCFSPNYYPLPNKITIFAHIIAKLHIQLMASIKAILFDLDGTLLDTIEDLTASTNYALRTFSLPERSIDEVRSFVGNGVRRLMQQAVPANTDEELFEEIFAAFKDYYFKHSYDYTRPYQGIMPLLLKLKENGILMGIVSNKWHTAVQELSHCFFSDLISVAIGESETTPRKPNPEGVFAALKALGCKAEETLYVGDSDIDIMTAQNAGVPCISVTWGFRNEAFLKSHNAEILIHSPQELLSIIEEEGC